MTYKTISTTWVESIAAAATLSLGLLIAGDAYLQHQAHEQAAAEQAMPLVQLEPVTITAQRGLVQLEPVTITAQRTVVRLAPVTIAAQRSTRNVQSVQAAAAHLSRL